MDNTKYKCPVKNCTVEYEKLISLSIHYRKYHKGTAKNLYVILFCNNKEPTCACGCGGEVKFLSISRGFREYIRGHVSRVKNNFVCKKAQEGSIKTRRKMIEDGTWKPFALKETGEAWNKGLTKETDQRIRNMTNSIINSEKETGARSKRMKIGRISGAIRSLCGSEHSQWNGGTSSLTHVCRSYKDLYHKWKYPILLKSNFSCNICGGKSGEIIENDIKIILEVHHNVEKMAEIIHKIAKKHNWEKTFATKTIVENGVELHKHKLIIAKDVAKYHIDNNVPGIVLCMMCHNLEHGKPKYNRIKHKFLNT